MGILAAQNPMKILLLNINRKIILSPEICHGHFGWSKPNENIIVLLLTGKLF
jgi:hypothetical protein